MADVQFHQSQTGKKFYEQDVPRIVKALERIADALEGTNKLEEKRFKQEIINEHNRAKKDKETIMKAIREKYGDVFFEKFIEKTSNTDGK